MGKKTVVYTYNRLLFSTRKANPAICNSIDEPGGHHDKQNKPDRERQILPHLSYMWNLKQLNS